MVGGVVVLVVLVVSTAIGLLLQRRNGAIRDVPTHPDVDLASLGVDAGTRATLLQFSSAFCAPCRATRRVLIEVAGLVDGVSYAEVDAESNLELVRRLGIARTPTTLVLDQWGKVVVRASGQPRKADVIAALDRV